MKYKNWLFGKNVLISGVSSGIGFHMAKILSSRYFCNVIGLGRNLEKLERGYELINQEIDTYYNRISKKKNNFKKGSFDYFVFDVNNCSGWTDLQNKLDNRFFKVDVLINNAGIMLFFDKFENQNIEDCRKVFETNFFAHIYSYKTFLNDLKERRGAVINISSSSALCPVIGTAIYSASKAAIKSFTEVLSMEHKKELYVAYVCPGFVQTDLFRNYKQLSGLVKKFSMSADKMANKIIKKISKRKNCIVLGKDAHLMNGFYKAFPNLTKKAMCGILKSSHDPLFDKVFK